MDRLYTVSAFVLDRQFTDLFAVIPGVASGIMFLAWLVQRPHNLGNLQLALAILAVVVLNATTGFSRSTPPSGPPRRSRRIGSRRS
jgi:hypothetical protein